MLTRLQFFARMRKLGFAKSRLQMTRMGLTYEKKIDEGRVTVTVPKSHDTTFHILGDVPYSGIFIQEIPDRKANWGMTVNPKDLGLNSMLEVCLGLCNGDITMKSDDERYPAE
jgi:hypothetical protein